METTNFNAHDKKMTLQHIESRVLNWNRELLFLFHSRNMLVFRMIIIYETPNKGFPGKFVNKVEVKSETGTKY